MKQRSIYTDFSFGEIGPRMGGRIDSGISTKGATVIRNMIVQEDGGLTKRTGSRRVANTIDFDGSEWGGKKSRIISTNIGKNPMIIELSDKTGKISNADQELSEPGEPPVPDIQISEIYTSSLESDYTVQAPRIGTSDNPNVYPIFCMDATNLFFTPKEVRDNELHKRRRGTCLYLTGQSVNATDLYNVEISEDNISWNPVSSYIVNNVNHSPLNNRAKLFTQQEISKKNVIEFGNFVNVPNPDGSASGVRYTEKRVDIFSPGYYLFFSMPTGINYAVVNTLYIRIKNVSQGTRYKTFQWDKKVDVSTIWTSGTSKTYFEAHHYRTKWGAHVQLEYSLWNDTLSSMDLFFGSKDTFIDQTLYGSLFTFTTPYNDQEIFQIRYVQVDDRILFTHPEHHPKTLKIDGGAVFANAGISNSPGDLNAGGNTYPACCTVFQGRLLLASTNINPNRVWSSKAGDPFDFNQTDPNNPASGFFFTLNSQRANKILWMEGRTDLILGTSSAEWRVFGAAGILTPGGIMASRQSTFGSAPIQGKLINDAIYFIQRDGRRLREYLYSHEQQAYQSPDVTQFAQHITQPAVVDTAFSQDPDNIIYTVLGNGKLALCTYNRSKSVMAWTLLETDGAYESIAIVAGVANEDDIWVTVNRQGRRYIERFSPRGENSAAEPIYMDSYISIFNPASTTITGLDHLNGKEVDIVIDREYYPRKTVEGGQVEIDQVGRAVHIGLPFVSRIKSTKIAENLGIGVLKRIVKVRARVYRTIGLKAGDPPEEQMFRQANDDSFNPFLPQDEDIEIFYPGGYDRSGQIDIVHDYPMPFTLLALQLDYEASDI